MADGFSFVLRPEGDRMRFGGRSPVFCPSCDDAYPDPSRFGRAWTLAALHEGIAAGREHTCALPGAGRVRCWGSGDQGALGYGNTDNIGDDETPASAGDVDVGGPVVALAAGAYHTCALLAEGRVRCWGDNRLGPLGYGNTEDVGDDETPASAGDVEVGGPVAALAAGGDHTCALLETSRVRCWGAGWSGQLGYGNTESIGDDETPASAGDVDLGTWCVP